MIRKALILFIAIISATGGLFAGISGWRHSASPVLTDGKLIVHIRKLRALNPETGEEIWNVSHGSSWGTPAPANIDGLNILITPQGMVLRPKDGKFLVKKIGHLSYSTPVIDNNCVYFIDEKGGKAVRLRREDDTIKSEVLWTNKPKRNRYYASSLIYDGLVYAITRGRTFSIIDAKDGKILLSKKLNLKGEPYPNITLAGKYIFVGSDKGTVKVLKPGREYKEVAAFTIGTFRSCPVFEGSRVYVRTYKELFCFGK